MPEALSVGDRQAASSFGKLIGWLAILSFGVITLGSLVRATDSGLACPDWPLCFDQVVPTFDYQIFLEWFHRLVAGSLSILLVFAIVKLVRSPLLRHIYGLQITAAGVLLVIQVVLGGLTVLHLLEPKIVSLHLINGTFFFAILLWMNAQGRALDPENNVRLVPVSPGFRALFIGLTVLVTAQVFLGGMVSTNHAGLACPDFPTCHGSWVPPPYFQPWLQMGHRFLAFAITGLIAAIGILASSRNIPKWSRYCTRLMPLIVLVQIALGVVNVYAHLPVWASVAHLGNAILLFAASLIATLDIHYQGVSYAALVRASVEEKKIQGRLVNEGAGS